MCRFGAGAKIITAIAITHIELIAHDREPHRMAAEEQQSVFDRMETEVERDISCPSAVPAGAVTRLGQVFVHGLFGLLRYISRRQRGAHTNPLNFSSDDDYQPRRDDAV